MNSLAKVLFLGLLVLALCFGSADAAVCPVKKKVNERVGLCDIQFTVWGCLKGLKWRYKAEARDPQSGAMAGYSWTKSAKGAAEEAANALFAQNPQLAARCFPSGVQEEFALFTNQA